VVCEDSQKVRVFFCTDPNLGAAEVLEGYSFRWPQEGALEVAKSEEKAARREVVFPVAA